MATFLTAMAWGAGASIGALVGLCGFIVFIGVYREKDLKASREANEKSVAALLHRNELSGHQIQALRSIASSMEQFRR
jgi:hypothetical protein